MMSKLDDIQNKHVGQYTRLFSESQYEYGSTKKPSKANSIKGKSRKPQKSIHLKKRQKRHQRSAQQKVEKNAEKPNNKI